MNTSSKVVPFGSVKSVDDIAHAALADIRARLGRSRVAAEWSRLTLQQRAMLCYGARLKPAEYAPRDLADMTDDEREAIRRALVEMKRGLRDFLAVDRAEWLHCRPVNAKTPSAATDGVLNSACVTHMARS